MCVKLTIFVSICIILPILICFLHDRDDRCCPHVYLINHGKQNIDVNYYFFLTEHRCLVRIIRYIIASTNQGKMGMHIYMAPKMISVILKQNDYLFASSSVKLWFERSYWRRTDK